MSSFPRFECQIEIRVSDLIDADRDMAYDMMMERATGTRMVMEVDYQVESGDGDVLTLTVSGNAVEAYRDMAWQYVEHCWEEEALEVFRTVAQDDPGVAARWLEEEGKRLLEQLTPDERAGLLEAGDRQLRQQLIRLLGHDSCTDERAERNPIA